MRSASKVFKGIGIFATFAAVLFAAASRFGFDNLQGVLVLGLFAFSCLYLGRALGRDADLDDLALPGAHAHEEGEEIHLPGPSWYPAFYGVTLPVLLFGLVLHSWPLTIAGVVLTVLVTIGWGLESVKEYRREIAHHKPVVLPEQGALDLAHQVVAFRRDHGGADAVVQHLGRGAAEIVLVGKDGAWGSLVARDVAQAREACALAQTDLHVGWPSGLGARVRTGEDQWREMGGERPFESASGHDAPRDGTTQVAARVFLGLGIFAIFATLLFAAASRFSFDNLQGVAILAAFSGSCYYLYLGLKNAKARPEDAAYAGEDYVTLEPVEPDPPVDLETLHLPGPSWWPAAFSVAAFVLVLGLVFHSLAGVGAGVLLLVVCCVGWGIESVHEYRQQISGQHHGAADALHNDPAPLAH